MHHSLKMIVCSYNTIILGVPVGACKMENLC